MDWCSIPPPAGSTPGLLIEAYTAGPLAACAVITIPEGGVLGWDCHEETEYGVVLCGLVQIELDGGHGALVDGRFTVRAGDRHRLIAASGEARVLARMGAPPAHRDGVA